MNALVHRDYSAYSGGLSVSIYPHRLELWNPGRLPEGLYPTDLKTARVSRPHNPDIAHVFFLRGLMERWGIGTRRIVEECRASGLPDPRWEEVGGGIRLTLYLRHAESAVLDELNERMEAFLAARRRAKPSRRPTTLSGMLRASPTGARGLTWGGWWRWAFSTARGTVARRGTGGPTLSFRTSRCRLGAARDGAPNGDPPRALWAFVPGAGALGRLHLSGTAQAYPTRPSLFFYFPLL